MVYQDGYFTVEDSICHQGVAAGPSPGPFEAIETFEKESAEFAIDRDKEGFVVTWNSKGFLKRVAVQST